MSKINTVLLSYIFRTLTIALQLKKEKIYALTKRKEQKQKPCFFVDIYITSLWKETHGKIGCLQEGELTSRNKGQERDFHFLLLCIF